MIDLKTRKFFSIFINRCVGIIIFICKMLKFNIQKRIFTFKIQRKKTYSISSEFRKFASPDRTPTVLVYGEDTMTVKVRYDDEDGPNSIGELLRISFSF